MAIGTGAVIGLWKNADVLETGFRTCDDAYITCFGKGSIYKWTCKKWYNLVERDATAGAIK